MIHMLHVISFTLKSAVIAGLYDTITTFIYSCYITKNNIYYLKNNTLIREKRNSVIFKSIFLLFSKYLSAKMMLSLINDEYIFSWRNYENEWVLCQLRSPSILLSLNYLQNFSLKFSQKYCSTICSHYTDFHQYINTIS